MENLKNKILTNLTPAEHKSVKINLVTDYKWGRGWTTDEAKRFHNEVLTKLTEAGYCIVKPKDSFSSPLLHTNHHMDPTEIYLHPMEFSGYAKVEDIECIIAILKGCKSIYEVNEPIIEDVYNLSDKQYRQLLSKYSKDILEWAKNYKQKGLPIYDIGFHFAQENRIPRLGVGSCYSSSDVDIVFVENAAMVFEGLELL